MSEVKVSPKLFVKLTQMVAEGYADVDELFEIVDQIARANNLGSASTVLVIDAFEQAIT